MEQMLKNTNTTVVPCNGYKTSGVSDVTFSFDPLPSPHVTLSFFSPDPSLVRSPPPCDTIFTWPLTRQHASLALI